MRLPQVSMSAELWQPTVEVQRGALLLYMREWRARGYTVVAVEQTANSKPLTEYQFQPKTLLVVGNEQNGIDAEVLPS